VPAEGEQRLDPGLERGQAQLLEPLDLDPCERLEGQVGKRIAAPERERLVERLHRACGVVLRELLAPAFEEALERVDVELSRLEPE
jgi:hypothetical protein